MNGTIKRRENTVVKKTIEMMKNLGTYKEEFQIAIRRYAEIRIQFDLLYEEWTNSGRTVLEEYTNKAGEMCERKTLLYSIIEKMRGELTELENQLGLTPKGLKSLQSKGLEKKKKSALDKLLE